MCHPNAYYCIYSLIILAVIPLCSTWWIIKWISFICFRCLTRDCTTILTLHYSLRSIIEIYKWFLILDHDSIMGRALSEKLCQILSQNQERDHQCVFIIKALLEISCVSHECCDLFIYYLIYPKRKGWHQKASFHKVASLGWLSISIL